MTDVPSWSALPYWPALTFWSATVVSLAISGLGLFRRRPSLLIGGAILVLPPSLYLTAPPRFQFYRYRCGRDRRLKQLWGETD